MGKVQIPKFEARGKKFPDLCMCCGVKPAASIKSKNFAYVNPLAYLGIFCGLLPFLIIALILQKKQTVNLRVCSECEPGFKALPQYGCLTGLLFFSLFCLGIAMTDSGGGPGLYILVASLATPFIYIAYYAVTGRKYAITCAKIDDEFVTLQVPNSVYADAYTNHRTPTQKPPARSGPPLPKCRHCPAILSPASQFCQSCGRSQL